MDNVLVEHGIGAGLPIKSTSAITVTPNTTDQTLAKGQYLKDITVKGDSNLISANILSGKSIFGVNGNVIAGKRFASGSFTSPSSTSTPYTVSGLSFTPAVVVVYLRDASNSYHSFQFLTTKSAYYEQTASYNAIGLIYWGPSSIMAIYDNDGSGWHINSDGFTVKCGQTVELHYWVAYE